MRCPSFFFVAPLVNVLPLVNVQAGVLAAPPVQPFRMLGSTWQVHDNTDQEEQELQLTRNKLLENYDLAKEDDTSISGTTLKKPEPDESRDSHPLSAEQELLQLRLEWIRQWSTKTAPGYLRRALDQLAEALVLWGPQGTELGIKEKGVRRVNKEVEKHDPPALLMEWQNQALAALDLDVNSAEVWFRVGELFLTSAEIVYYDPLIRVELGIAMLRKGFELYTERILLSTENIKTGSFDAEVDEDFLKNCDREMHVGKSGISSSSLSHPTQQEDAVNNNTEASLAVLMSQSTRKNPSVALYGTEDEEKIYALHDMAFDLPVDVYGPHLQKSYPDIVVGKQPPYCQSLPAFETEAPDKSAWTEQPRRQGVIFQGRLADLRPGEIYKHPLKKWYGINSLQSLTWPLSQQGRFYSSMEKVLANARNDDQNLEANATNQEIAMHVLTQNVARVECNLHVLAHSFMTALGPGRAVWWLKWAFTQVAKRFEEEKTKEKKEPSVAERPANDGVRSNMKILKCEELTRQRDLLALPRLRKAKNKNVDVELSDFLFLSDNAARSDEKAHVMNDEKKDENVKPKSSKNMINEQEVKESSSSEAKINAKVLKKEENGDIAASAGPHAAVHSPSSTAPLPSSADKASSKKPVHQKKKLRISQVFPTKIAVQNLLAQGFFSEETIDDLADTAVAKYKKARKQVQKKQQAKEDAKAAKGDSSKKKKKTNKDSDVEQDIKSTPPAAAPSTLLVTQKFWQAQQNNPRFFSGKAEGKKWKSMYQGPRSRVFTQLLAYVEAVAIQVADQVLGMDVETVLNKKASLFRAEKFGLVPEAESSSSGTTNIMADTSNTNRSRSTVTSLNQLSLFQPERTENEARGRSDLVQEFMEFQERTLFDPRRRQPYISFHWTLVADKDGQHPVHTHHSGIVSCAVYLRSDGMETPLIFLDPRGKGVFFDYKENNKKSPAVPFNAGWQPNAPFHQPYYVFPKKGDVVCFPSWLVHQVPPHGKETGYRVGIAFLLMAPNRIDHWFHGAAAVA
ncbi:unnamed protein product [Amoebophrya sp. A120]|nr:unnamed protein product [Amoebophrya sp. A120]|eukprot:GSA120T00010827001.1